MSKLVVTWYDQSGMEYQACTIYDTDTDVFFDYDFTTKKYMERLSQEEPSDDTA